MKNDERIGVVLRSKWINTLSLFEIWTRTACAVCSACAVRYVLVPRPFQPVGLAFGSLRLRIINVCLYMRNQLCFRNRLRCRCCRLTAGVICIFVVFQTRNVYRSINALPCLFISHNEKKWKIPLYVSCTCYKMLQGIRFSFWEPQRASSQPTCVYSVCLMRFTYVYCVLSLKLFFSFLSFFLSFFHLVTLLCTKFSFFFPCSF